MPTSQNRLTTKDLLFNFFSESRIKHKKILSKSKEKGLYQKYFLI